MTYASMTQEQQQAEFAGYMTFNQAVQAKGALKSAEQLQPANLATTIRIRARKTLTTDDPSAENKEVLGRTYILECANLDEAIELSADIPVAKHGSVEICPIMEQYQ